MDADDAFASLLIQEQSLLRAIARARSPRPSLIDDMVQEANLCAWARRKTFRAGSNFASWLRVVAHHAIVDYFRSKRGKLRPQEALGDAEVECLHSHPPMSAQGFAAAIAAGELLTDLQRRWFSRLSDQSQAMVLALAAGDPIGGAPEGTIKSRLHRIREGAPRA